jgi:hypothetical protein
MLVLSDLMRIVRIVDKKMDVNKIWIVSTQYTLTTMKSCES